MLVVARRSEDGTTGGDYGPRRRATRRLCPICRESWEWVSRPLLGLPCVLIDAADAGGVSTGEATLSEV